MATPPKIWAFNDKLEILCAFKHSRDTVKKFFVALGDHPKDYGVPSDYIAEAKAAVQEFVKLSQQELPFTLSGDVPTLRFGSSTHAFEMPTIFDIMGWIFSVASSPPKDASPSNFYFPLTALYLKFCLLFTNIDLEGYTSQLMPTMVAAIWFVGQDGHKRVILGANLDTPSEKERRKKMKRWQKKMATVESGIKENDKDLSEKDKLQERRRLRLVEEGYILATEKNVDDVKGPKPYLKPDGPPPEPISQKFGHCAETYPLMFLKSLPNQVEGSVRGFALSPSRYKMDDKTTSFQPDHLNQGLTPPCRNCEYLIFKAGLTQEQFAV